ncbi:MAG: type I restriction enzyme HsdR N-terminal domain-containing protein [Candidatus Coatesbacteria bacterium]|nr:type I restriction enzyme HsdR N-terminal domain-containing protein [Candidatus Coatesbacteria bacterium]
MEELKRLINELRECYHENKNEGLNEQETRQIFIDRILNQLNWFIHDRKRVRLEFPTLAGKTADYALMIENKAKIFIEAKALKNPLNDPKDISQIDSYASNIGHKWFILSTGVLWKIFDSSKLCPAPEKIVIEINIINDDINQVIDYLKLLLYDEVNSPDFDNTISQVVFDKEIEKTIEYLLENPSKAFINAIHQSLPESIVKCIKNKNIEAVIKRMQLKKALQITEKQEKEIEEPTIDSINQVSDNSIYTEEMHLEGKPDWVICIYFELDRLINSSFNEINKKAVKMTINWLYLNKAFCWIHLGKIRSNSRSLKIWIETSDIDYFDFNKYDFVRPMVIDGKKVGHYGGGNLELNITSIEQIPAALELIKQSYNKIRDGIKNK